MPASPRELIARNIPNAASMCYDAGAKQLVIPMNPNNGLAFVPLIRFWPTSDQMRASGKPVGGIEADP